MNIYASTKTHNNDPRPWEATTEQGTVYRSARNLNHGDQWKPRPEYGMSRTHEGNPVLIAARENWDHGSDPWGQALSWLDALGRFDSYETVADAEEWGESHDTITLIGLAANDGSWDLSAPTPEHIAHAFRVFDRMADVARANGLDY